MTSLHLELKPAAPCQQPLKPSLKCPRPTLNPNSRLQLGEAKSSIVLLKRARLNKMHVNW